MTFTPEADGDLLVSIDYEALITSSSHSDWTTSGNTVGSRAFISQGGTTTTGSRRGMSGTRETQSVQWNTPVVAGVAVEAGLSTELSGFVSAQYFNVQLKIELAKR